MASEHSRGHGNYVHEIDAVLTLEAVEKLLFRDLPRDQGSSPEVPNLSETAPTCESISAKARP